MKTRVLAALALAAASARVCVLAGEVLEDERAPSKSDLAGRVDPAPAELAPVTTHIASCDYTTVFPSVGTTSSNASHHGCAHFGLPY